MKQAIGISVHTGWAACVVVSGSLSKPQIVANEIIEMLDDSQRFCFHMAAEMKRPAAEKFLADVRKKATVNAKKALAALATQDVHACAIVAKDTDPGDLDTILASHPRVHTAEGCLYRDVLREASPVPVRLVAPATLDHTKVGKISPPPWGKDQKVAMLAAFTVLAE